MARQPPRRTRRVGHFCDRPNFAQSLNRVLTIDLQMINQERVSALRGHRNFKGFQSRDSAIVNKGLLGKAE